MRYRRVLSACIGLLVLSLILAGCGSGEEATSTAVPTTAPTAVPATSAPGTTAAPTSAPAATATARPTTPPQPTPTAVRVSSGEIKIAETTLRNFDMILLGGGSRYYLDPLYDHTIGSDNEGQLDPKSGFATSWTVSADLKTWTWKLRDNAVFHTGEKATSKDLKFTFDNYIKTLMPASGASAIKAEVGSITTPDDTTFVASLTAPRLNWLWKFSRAGSSGELPYLYSKSYWEQVGDKVVNQKPVGSGIYKFKSLTISDRINYEAVDKHWYVGVPRTKNLTILVIPEEGTRVALLKSGDVDLTVISKSQAKSIKTNTTRAIIRADSGYSSNGFDDINIPTYEGYGKNPLNDVRVRQALAWYAIDRQAIVDTFLGGFGRAVGSGGSTTDPGRAEPLPVPKFDPAKAKQLLAEAGYPNGFEIEFYTWFQPSLVEGGEINEAIATYWERIGMKVKRDPLAMATWRANRVAGKKATKPTVQGMYQLGGTKPVNSDAAGNIDDPLNYNTNGPPSPELVKLGKAWANSLSNEDYVKNGKAYNTMDQAEVSRIILFYTGETFGAGQKIPEKWVLGKGGFSFQYEYMAGMWY